MRTSTTRAGRAVAAAAMVAAVATVMPAAAGSSTSQDTRGLWTVFYGTPDTRGYGTPDTRGGFTMQVLTQDNRRFHGVISGYGDSAAFPMEGTISASDNLSFQARSLDGIHLAGHGQASDTVYTPGGAFITPLVLEGPMTKTRPGLADAIRAQLVAVRQPVEATRTRLDGPYEGQLHPVGGIPATLKARFNEARSDGMVAEITLGENESFQGTFALVDPETEDGAAGFALVAGGDSGLLVMRGIIGPDYRIQGELHVTGNDGSTLTEGTFELAPFAPTTHG